MELHIKLSGNPVDIQNLIGETAIVYAEGIKKLSAEIKIENELDALIERYKKEKGLLN